MRSLRYLPLVFLIGVDGFVMFLPYLGLVAAAAYAVHRSRPQTRPAPVAVS